MKKKKCLCILMIFMLLLTGCQNQSASNSENSGATGTNIEETSDDTEKNSETTEDETQTSSDNEQETSQKSAILETAKSLDDDGILYYIENPRMESSLQQEVALYQDNLLVWGYGENGSGEVGFQLTLLSLQTGEVLEEKTFPNMELPNAQICGETIVVTDWGTGNVYFLGNTSSIDKKDIGTSFFEVIAEYQTGTEYCAIYASPNTEKLYVFTKEGVKVMHTQTKETEVLFEDAVMLFASSRCGDSVTVTYTNKNTQLNESGVVDLSEGVAKKIPFEGAFTSEEYNNGIWLAKALGEEDAYYLGKDGRPNSFIPHEKNAQVTLLADPLRLMATTYDTDGTPNMTLYSLDGKFLSQCKLPIAGATMMYEPIWSEADGGYFFTVITPEGKDMLLFWDFSVPQTGEDIMLQSEYDGKNQTNSVLSDALFQRADSISKTYGVEIVMGEQTNEKYGSFLMAQELDENYIAEALDAVENALSWYPKGFMEQLLYGSQKKLEIHLTGAFQLIDLFEIDISSNFNEMYEVLAQQKIFLSYSDFLCKPFHELAWNGISASKVNGFTSYIGLAEEQEGKNVIVLDITMPGSIEQTLCHEIMHIIDNKLVFDAKIREDALYSEEVWNSFNPADFSYTEDKLHLPENIWSDGYDAYFIDVYSRTFPREDRARIMEYAMVGADWAFSSSEGRYEKLKYLCECIRDAFDTEGWPKQTVWEQTLENASH